MSYEADAGWRRIAGSEIERKKGKPIRYLLVTNSKEKKAAVLSAEHPHPTKWSQVWEGALVKGESMFDKIEADEKQK